MVVQDSLLYESLLGVLQYVIITCLKITYYVNKVSIYAPISRTSLEKSQMYYVLSSWNNSSQSLIRPSIIPQSLGLLMLIGSDLDDQKSTT